jgi:hypothetical protein
LAPVASPSAKQPIEAGCGRRLTADGHRPLLTLVDQLLDGLDRRIRRHEERHYLGGDLVEVDEVLAELDRRLLQRLHDDLRPHVGEQQAVAVRLALAAVDLVADLAGGTREEGILEVGVDVVAPHRGEDADVAVGTAALGGRDHDLDIALRKGRPGRTAEGAGQQRGARNGGGAGHEAAPGGLELRHAFLPMIFFDRPRNSPKDSPRPRFDLVLTVDQLSIGRN